VTAAAVVATSIEAEEEEELREHENTHKHTHTQRSLSVTRHTAAEAPSLSHLSTLFSCFGVEGRDEESQQANLAKYRTAEKEEGRRESASLAGVWL
jgi:hypothetical protein